MSKLNSNELTTMHTEMIHAVQIARTLTNISRRAASLLADGYQVRAYNELYVVENPKGEKYLVTHGATIGYSCSCPCFTDYRTCKHLEGVDLMKQDEADGASLDALEDARHDLYAYRY